MKKIILDTNFLLIPAQYKVDIFAELDRLFPEETVIYTLDRSLEELDKVAREGRQKEKLQVKLIKALLKTQNIKIISVAQEGIVDDLLVDYAKQGYIIATQDMGLKQRIKHKLVTLRQNKYLIFRE
ncbi:hypothetical protein HZC31_03010 [Candidatus Woesearchaeota archaeon]|nr:hypothetical protein [Candidatus Woesearchaeota archaeon]